MLTVGQPRYNSTGTLLEGIQIWSERKPSLTREDVKQRALEEIRWEVAQGTLYIRSHVDVCDPVLTALRALIEVREEVRDICELQLVAFSQDGILSFPNGRELMRTAMELERRSSNGIDRASQGTSLYDANARSSQDAQRNNHERSSWKKARQNLEKLINENAIRSLFLLP